LASIYLSGNDRARCAVVLATIQPLYSFGCARLGHGGYRRLICGVCFYRVAPLAAVAGGIRGLSRFLRFVHRWVNLSDGRRAPFRHRCLGLHWALP
jgi:hypothetical protein